MDDSQLPDSGLYDSKGEYIIVKLNKVVTEKVEDKDSSILIIMIIYYD